MRHTEFYKVGHINGRVEERKLILDLLRSSINSLYMTCRDPASVNHALDRLYKNLIEDLQSHKIED